MNCPGTCCDDAVPEGFLAALKAWVLHSSLYSIRQSTLGEYIFVYVIILERIPLAFHAGLWEACGVRTADGYGKSKSWGPLM